MDEASYISSIGSIGLKATWNQICFDVLQSIENSAIPVESFGDFYEAGLAASDKDAKKESDNITLHTMLQWLWHSGLTLFLATSFATWHAERATLFWLTLNILEENAPWIC